MTSNYDKVWSTMNDLEQAILKLNNVKEIIDSATEAMERDKTKAETLNYAAYEYLEILLDQIDEKFQKAWKATVVDLRQSGQSADSWDLTIGSDMITNELYIDLPQELVDFVSLKEGDKLQWLQDHNDNISIIKL